MFESLDCLKKFAQLAADGVAEGWHEKNGGNISYRMRPEEVAFVRSSLPVPRDEWTPIGASVPSLEGEFFLVTGSGKHIRNVPRDLEDSSAIAEIDASGEYYRLWWGLKNGGRPTSEFAPHLMNHAVKKEVSNNKHRVMYHAHPVNLVALTFVLPMNDKAFTRALWSMMTECPVIFPEGIGVIPWMVPGGKAIAIETSKVMERCNIAVWAHHGLFCSGEDFDMAFGLMETVEKAADILVRVMSTGQQRYPGITTENLRDLAATFNLTLPEKFLVD